MNKLIYVLLLCVICISCGKEPAGDVVENNELPPEALQFISANFHSSVSAVKVDDDALRGKEYEVHLADGTELDFNSDGTWDSIDMPQGSSLPDEVLPKAITTYIANNFAGQSIVSVTKDKGNYEVELQNGFDLIFDEEGIFLRNDD